jgi:hydrogenase maturation protease
VNSLEKTLVIGIGNALRRDDTVGLAVAHWLKQRAPHTLPIMEHDADGVNLMEAWRGMHHVFLIDAICSGATPGSVHRFDAGKTGLPNSWFPCSSHLIGVAEAVALARTLLRLPDQLIVYGIEGAEFGYGERLSPAVASAVEKVGTAILQEICHQTS